MRALTNHTGGWLPARLLAACLPAAFLPAAFLLAACLPAAGPTVLADEPAPTRILLIGHQPDHPPGTHEYLHTCRVLAACLENTPGVETVVSDGWPKDAATLKNVKSIVVYSSPAAEMLLDAPHRDQVAELMQSGTGLVTIHWASSIYQKNFDRLGKQWMSYLGGTWISNVGLSTDKSPLLQLVPDHPICRGWKPYELRDEFYLNPTLGKDAVPLLQVRTKDQDVVVGWAYERPDGGRAYGTTLGHFYVNFQLEPFRQPLINAILWTAHVPVPEDGAPISVDEDRLRLPAGKNQNEKQ